VDSLAGLLRTGNILPLLLFIAWCAWWLLCVNWQKVWPMLAAGGWAPVLLLVGLVSGVWASLEPRPFTFLSFMTIPNGWWQLGEVCLLALVALFCGWLQGTFGWTPWEIPVEPPPVSHGHGHHGNGHASH
jgi:hypothetical protein